MSISAGFHTLSLRNPVWYKGKYKIRDFFKIVLKDIVMEIASWTTKGLQNRNSQERCKVLALALEVERTVLVSFSSKKPKVKYVTKFT